MSNRTKHWSDAWWNKQLSILRRRSMILLTTELMLILVGIPLWLSRQPVPWSIPWPMPWPSLWLAVLVATLAIATVLLWNRNHQAAFAPGWTWRGLWHITHITHSVLWGVGFLFLVTEDTNTANAILASLAVIGGYALIPIPLTFIIFQLGLLLPSTLAFNLGFLAADAPIIVLLPAIGLAIALITGILSFCYSLWLHCHDLHQQNQDLSNWGSEKQEMETTIATLQELSLQDALTKLSNRRHFDQFYAREWRRSRRQKTPISTLMIDIDHFKQYNDEYGHLQGDDCLRQIGKILEQYTRRGGDVAARYGGEEFVLILPYTPVGNAVQLADRIRQAIADLEIPHSRSKHQVVTVTIGVAGAMPDDKQKAKGVIQRADEALYAGKQQGRNCVVTAPEVSIKDTAVPLTDRPPAKNKPDEKN